MIALVILIAASATPGRTVNAMPPNEVGGPAASAPTNDTQEPAARSATKGSRQPARPTVYTAAERIAGLQQLLDEDKERLVQLQCTLATVEDEFKQTSDAFTRLDATVIEQRKVREGLGKDGTSPELQAQRAKLQELEAQRKTAQDRFDLVIRRRKTIQSQVETLLKKTQLEREALDRQMGVDPTPATQGEKDGEGVSAGMTSVDATVPPSWIVGPAVAPSVESTTSPSSPPAQAPLAADNVGGASKTPYGDERVREARRQLGTSEATQQAVEQQVSQIDRGIEIFQQDSDAEQQMLEMARQQGQMAQKRQAELRQRLEAGSAEGDRGALQQEIEQSTHEFNDATAAAKRHAQRLDTLRLQLDAVQASKKEALAQLDKAMLEVESASQWLKFMESHFAPHKVVDWLINRGPKILVTLACIVGFWWLCRTVVKRMVWAVVGRTLLGTPEERADRAHTLIGVFNSVIAIAILGVGLLAVLSQAGVDVTLLMGSAAVFGMAIAFGAQN